MKRDIVNQINEILSVLPAEECQVIYDYLSEMYSMEVKKHDK